MDPFRYQQFCPLARAAEILGHRWVILILRELFVGPQRFSDLRRRLPGLSSSVLTDRLVGLEQHGVIGRRDLPPPTAATVYELTDDGRALEPALLALTRWGTRHLTSPAPGDHVEPDWLGMAINAFARTGPSPARRFELRPYQGDREAVMRICGGPDGTQWIRDDLPVEVSVRAPVPIIIQMMRGVGSLETLLAADDVQVEGDVERLADLPGLFEADF